MSLHPEIQSPQPPLEAQAPQPQLFDYEKSGDVMLQTTAAEATKKFIDRTLPDLIERTRTLQDSFSVGQDLLPKSAESQLSYLKPLPIDHAKSDEESNSTLAFRDFVTVDKDSITADTRNELRRKGMAPGRVGVVSEPRTEPSEEEVTLAVNEKLFGNEHDARNLQVLEASSTDDDGEEVNTNMTSTKMGNVSIMHTRGDRGFQIEIDTTSGAVNKAQVMDRRNGQQVYQTIDPSSHEVVDMISISTGHLLKAVEEREQSNASARKQIVQSLN